MLYNILEFLEHSAALHPHKTAVVDEYKSCNYEELLDYSCRIGSVLSYRIEKSSPIIVYMEKGVDTICSFFGILYAGGFYALLNPELPKPRLEHIQSVLQSKFVITNKQLKASAKEVFPNAEIIVVESLKDAVIDKKSLEKIRKNTVDTDPLYINFTSGSTGIPKGIVVSHRSVIDFIDYFTDIFHITDKDIIANQAPFDFDVSVKDIYSTLKNAATMYIIPKVMFSFPGKLITYLNEKKVNTVIWAASALRIVQNLKALDKELPRHLRTIMFSGEVMPNRVLNYWRNYLPDVQYVNLYGPTEITCNCTFYKVDRAFQDEEVLPIGKPFENTGILLLNDKNEQAKEDETGEICVRGSSLALGYYNNPQKTREAFCQNPLNNVYPEIIYRTGDLGKYDKEGNLMFLSRKDYQIKHMGHRIELGEIEVVANALPVLDAACCIYDEIKEKIVMFYQAGEKCDRDVLKSMGQSLPKYMFPNKLKYYESLPLNKNGKIDRVLLKKEYMENE